MTLYLRNPVQRAQLDDLVRTYRAQGWTNSRIAAALGRCEAWVDNRVRALGLPKRRKPVTTKPQTGGLTSTQLEAYRLYRRKKFSAIEARAAVVIHIR